MTNSLSDRNVVVVGGSGGIGWAVAEAAMRAGARAFVLSRSPAAPTGARHISADVSDPASLAEAIARIGTIDHLAYTAWARQPSRPIASLETEHLVAAFQAKVFGAVSSIRLALPHLADEASITLTSGQVSRKYGVGTVLKGAVNAAVDAVGRHLAKELAPRRVNVVSPGVTDTAQWGEAGSEARKETLSRLAAALPVKRVATPEQMASAYLFAMTNPFVTGAVIDVDGGGLL